MKILLSEHDPAIYTIITKELASKGYTVDVFEKVHHALASIDNGYALFILELAHESAETLLMLKSIKDYYPSTPVIMLYLGDALNSETLKKAYIYGCDDVLKKPFLMDELEIKMTKLLHIRDDIVMLTPQCSFDFSTGMLREGSEKHYFSKKEKRLFTLLFSHKESVVSFETIRAMVWEGESVTLESIRSLMRRVRQKIPFPCIQTIVDTGYILKLPTLNYNNVIIKSVQNFYVSA
jgi:DNA-binding response OmpR family regulator